VQNSMLERKDGRKEGRKERVEEREKNSFCFITPDDEREQVSFGNCEFAVKRWHLARHRVRGSGAILNFSSKKKWQSNYQQ